MIISIAPSEAAVAEHEGTKDENDEVAGLISKQDWMAPFSSRIVVSAEKLSLIATTTVLGKTRIYLYCYFAWH